jgi:hypothetical protein
MLRFLTWDLASLPLGLLITCNMMSHLFDLDCEMTSKFLLCESVQSVTSILDVTFDVHCQKSFCHFGVKKRFGNCCVNSQKDNSRRTGKLCKMLNEPQWPPLTQTLQHTSIPSHTPSPPHTPTHPIHPPHTPIPPHYTDSTLCIIPIHTPTPPYTPAPPHIITPPHTSTSTHIPTLSVKRWYLFTI